VVITKLTARRLRGLSQISWSEVNQRRAELTVRNRWNQTQDLSVERCTLAVEYAVKGLEPDLFRQRNGSDLHRDIIASIICWSLANVGYSQDLASPALLTDPPGDHILLCVVEVCKIAVESGVARLTL
jgi:hypothetical protein